MKNGRAMRGHARRLVPLGKRQFPRLPPSGGWIAQCECGWESTPHVTNQEARLAYREHLDYEIDSVPRECRRCGETKPASEFADRYSRHLCKRCYSETGNEWQRANPEASARHKRNHHLLRKFGITLAEAEQMLDDQGGVCAICEEEISDARGYEPHIDHDHETGRVRGVLCFLCNAGLGQFRDNPQRLKNAIAYLERTR